MYICDIHSILFNKILIWFDRTALYAAVEIGNIGIIKLLLTNDKIDPNITNILTLI